MSFERSLMSLLVSAALLVATGAHAGANVEYVAYEGDYPARLSHVDGIGRATLQVPVWTGFVRTLDITVAGVVLPREGDGAPACERDIARRGRQYTESVLAAQPSITVHDIRMLDSAATTARADVRTPAGNLAELLVTHGFARRDPLPPKTPWCR